MPPIREMQNQPTWVDSGLPDLRSLDREYRSEPLEQLPAATDVDTAIEIVAAQFGFIDPHVDRISYETPAGPVDVVRSSLFHTVEKRPDARERFSQYALDTLLGPLEVWKVGYSDGSHRLAFIGAYATKYQMLVIVSFVGGQVLWNFMHSDARSLNKHRHGELIYKRYTIL